MFPCNPYEIVREAIARDELDLLLLGNQKYRYLPYWSSACGNTDLPELLDAMLNEAERRPELDVKEALEYALNKILQTNDGLLPAAECVLYEVRQRSESLSSFDLPLENIADKLRERIGRYKSDLFANKTGNGALLEDGLLGVLRQLSIVTQRLGGPSFFDIPQFVSC